MQNVIKALLDKKSFLILGHERPDGDAIGSVCAMSKFLSDNGKSVTTLFVDQLPEKYHKIIPVEYIREVTLEEINSFDAVIVVDSATIARINLPLDVNFSDITTIIINIDHHFGNNVTGSINYVSVDSAACAEIIATIVNEMEEKHNFVVSSEVAEMLYLGIVTDTGSFRFANTTATTFAYASYIAAKGANLGKIINAAFFSKKFKQLKFEAEMINSHVKSHFDNQFIYATITRELLDKYQFNMRDGESVIEFLREIDTAKVVAIIYPTSAGFKISMRSKDRNISVGEIARRHGGGGHEMAAGASFENMTYEEIEEIFLKEIGSKLNYEI